MDAPRDRRVSELVQLYREVFSTTPIPPYPPNMGIDPVGVDEYAPFANRRWTDVDAQYFASTTYDICPAIGFKLDECPHIWSYFVPGFVTAFLLHEGEHDIVDAFMSSLRDIPVPPPLSKPPTPWWGGTTPMENYTEEQRRAVIELLEFLQEFGEEAPIDYDWKRSDGRLLERWQSAGKEER